MDRNAIKSVNRKLNLSEALKKSFVYVNGSCNTSFAAMNTKS
jgi:hypothetical protein